ncbi:MAG: hypothetical protein KDF54_02630, partial [Hydrogenophaga sp.]|nr:hypothetical protein [Hydrogenophaga sp.]
MQRAKLVSSIDDAWAQRATAWMVALVAIPLTLFAWWVYLQYPSRLDGLQRIQEVQVWHEDIGSPVFDQASL